MAPGDFILIFLDYSKEAQDKCHWQTSQWNNLETLKQRMEMQSEED